MKLYSIGEALIDCMPYERNSFVPVVGGAPANVAACYAKLGGDSAFIGKVGNDIFGEKIVDTLKEKNVDTSFMKKTDKANTALSFVSLKENGERSFSFYRNPSADMFLYRKDVKNISFSKNDILHFCSIDLIDMPVKYATKYLVKKAKKEGGIISFDPNLRKNLWDDHSKYKKTITQFIKYADILKFSDDELDFIFDSNDYQKIASSLIANGAKAVIITFGEKGSKCFAEDKVFSQDSFPIHCVDTTGAGDSFIGTFLKFIDTNNLKNSIAEAIKMASAASAVVCTKKGVLSSLPTLQEIKKFIKEKNGNE